MSIYVGANEISSLYRGTTTADGYVGPTKIWPTGWHPSANTLAYCPLEQDGADITGNYTFTVIDSSGTSFSDNGYGLNVLKKTSISNYERVSCSTHAGTIGIWARLSYSPTTEDNGTLISQGELYGLYYDNGWLGGTGIVAGQNYSGTQYTTNHYTTNLTNWHLYVRTWDGTDLKLYVDGQLFDSVSVTNAPTVSELNLLGIGNPYFSRGLKGEFSKALWEIPAWSAGEIKAYYNQICTNYGLSPIQ